MKLISQYLKTLFCLILIVNTTELLSQTIKEKRPVYEEYTKLDSARIWYFTDDNKYLISIGGDVVDCVTGNPICVINGPTVDLKKQFFLKPLGPIQLVAPIEGYLNVAGKAANTEDLVNKLNSYIPIDYKRGYGDFVTFINEDDYTLWGVNRTPNFFSVKNRIHPEKELKYMLETNEDVTGYDSKSENVVIIKSYDANGSKGNVGDVALIKPFTGERKQLFKSKHFITNYRAGVSGNYWLFFRPRIYSKFLVYDFNKSKVIDISPEKLPFLMNEYILSAAITPNDQLIVASGYASDMNLAADPDYDGGWKKALAEKNLGKLKFRLINISDFSITKEWEASLPYSITYSNDGSLYVLTDPQNGQAKVYNTVNGELVSTLVSARSIERYKTDLSDFIADSLRKEVLKRDNEIKSANAVKRAEKNLPDFNKQINGLINQLKALGWEVKNEFAVNNDGAGFIDMPKFFVRTEDSLNIIISSFADKQSEISYWYADMGFPGKDKTFLFNSDCMSETLNSIDYYITYTPVFAGLANTWFRMKDIKLQYPLKKEFGKMYYLSIPKTKYNKEAMSKLGFHVIESNLFTAMYNEFEKMEAEKRAKLEEQRKREKELELERANKLLNNYTTCGLCGGKGEISQTNDCSCCKGLGKVAHMNSEFHKMSDKRIVRYTYTSTGKIIEHISYEPIGYYTYQSTYDPCSCCSNKSSKTVQCPECKGKGKVVKN